MTNKYNIFESGSGKWIRIPDDVGDLIFTSDRFQATTFNIVTIIQANEAFWEFPIYEKTLRVVLIGSNVSPDEWLTVREFIKENKKFV